MNKEEKKLDFLKKKLTEKEKSGIIKRQVKKERKDKKRSYGIIGIPLGPNPSEA